MTERDMSDQELRESEHQLRAVYDSALEAFLIAGDDGRYVGANPAACALLGVSLEDLLGSRASDFMEPGFDFEQAWGAFLEQGSGHGELAIVRPDGSLRYVEFNAVSNVLPGRHLSILRDVTERTRAEAALRRKEESLRLLAVENARLYDEAQAANRAKDQFLAALSHELRTPLTPVLALISKLERNGFEGDLGESLRRDLGVIRKNVELEARLIDDLLDLTRISHGKIELRREVTPVHPLLLHALEICCDATASGVTLETDFRAPEPLVWADGPRLTQVFWNLLSNAVKFTPEGGTIRVSTRIEPAAAGRSVAVEIADTGVGIEPEALPRIFKAFEQEPGTPQRSGGLGLGLAISKAILDVHGGSLSAVSGGRGRGTTFTVRMPLHEGPAEAPPARAEEPRAAAQPRSILLVEDHEDTAVAMADLLRGQGHRVVVAGSLGAAREAVAGSSGIDLVISDLGLPDGSGLTLMRELKERYGLPGIAVSGYGSEEDRRQSRIAGFAAHLTKPITFDSLLDEMRRIGSGPAP